MRRIVCHKILPETGISDLESKYQFEFYGPEVNKEDFLSAVSGSAGIISSYNLPIDAEVLDAAGSSLKVIANYASGYANIDLEECRKRDIRVVTVAGSNTDAAAVLEGTTPPVKPLV
jgi:glyoxylate reductase